MPLRPAFGETEQIIENETQQLAPKLSPRWLTTSYTFGKVHKNEMVARMCSVNVRQLGTSGCFCVPMTREGEQKRPPGDYAGGQFGTGEERAAFKERA
jgi:hypothetical protein